MNNQEIENLRQFQHALNILVEALDKKVDEGIYDKLFNGVTNAVGEIMLNGIEYQIQMRLEPLKSSWIAEDGIEFIAIDSVKASMEEVSNKFNN